MKKWIGILMAVLICIMIPLTALADSEGDNGGQDTPPDAVTITHADSADDAGSDTYKAWLMESFDKTLLGANVSIRNQISKVLYREEINVTYANYVNIQRYVNDVINTEVLSEGAALNQYTQEDYRIAADLIRSICNELGLEYSIDPSVDSQNEYAMVVTIKKDGKLLGKIFSDAKTDEVEEPVNPKKPSVGWIIAGGILITFAAAFGVFLVIRTERKKKEA